MSTREHRVHTATERPITNCATGCTIRGQHIADGQPHDKCRGCTPRPAEHGNLCPWCWTRLNGDLIDTPALLAHLYDIGQPTAGHKPTDGRSGTDPAHRNALPAEWLDADELENEIVSWVHVILEEHPARLTGPRMRWSQGGTAGGPTTGETWHVDPRPVGTPEPHALITWLLPQLPWAAHQEWAHEMRRSIGNLVGTLKAKWPMDERGHHVPGIPCPRCDQLALWYDPPTPERPTMQVTCTNEQCGRMFPETEWDRMRGLITIAAERGILA